MAGTKVEETLAALAARTWDPFRDAKYDTASMRIGAAALLPSRVWNDSAVWTSMHPSRRSLVVRGRLDAGRYHLAADSAAPPPAGPAESRHVIALTRLSDSEFAWNTEVAYGLGALRPADVAGAVGALLSSGEGRGEHDIRADYRAATPRASHVMGQLFRLDSAHTAHRADSSTLVTLAATVTPSNLEARYPEFASNMQRYAHNTRMHWRLADASGAVFLDFKLRDGRIHIRVRTQGGRMIPLSGPALALPDTLVLHGDMTLKVRVFTAGFRNYRAAFIRTNDVNAASVAIESREEPDWVLPPATERLLRTPLRRPFQGRGASFRIGVHDAGGQSILLRQSRLEVQESAILRFLTRVSSTAYHDFSGKAERQQMQWLRELFDALVLDARAL